MMYEDAALPVSWLLATPVLLEGGCESRSSVLPIHWTPGTAWCQSTNRLCSAFQSDYSPIWSLADFGSQSRTKTI